VRAYRLHSAASAVNGNLEKENISMRTLLRAALIIGTLGAVSTPIVAFAGDAPAKAAQKDDAKAATAKPKTSTKTKAKATHKTTKKTTKKAAKKPAAK
jgi:hypothetical protein